MQVTRYGFVVDYDTTKMQKYNKEFQLKIVELKRSGLSIRKIAKELNIPSGSIHYILRNHGEVNTYTSRPSNKYITRKEAMYYYDISNSQFDYYRSKYKHMFKKVGNVVYSNRDVFEDHIIDRVGYIGNIRNITKNKGLK